VNFEKMLAELRGERDLIDKVIVTIENLAGRGKRGRGRPLSSVTKSKQNLAMNSASEKSASEL
jgi:hypothetical protein